MNLEKRFIITVFILLLLLFLCRALKAENKKIVIKLKDNAVVERDYVYLKDIALVIGNDKLKNLKIAKSPYCGEFIYLNKYFIETQIRNFLKDKKFLLYGPRNIKVTRKYFVYTKEIIKKICLNFLKQHEKEIFKNNRWKLIKIISPPRLILPYKDADVKVELNENNIFNKLLLMITFYKRGTDIQLRKINAIAFVEIYKKVFVAKRNIPYNHLLSSDMFEYLEVPVKRMDIDYVKDASEIQGKISTRFIRKGEILTYNMIKSPPLVKRGSIVHVYATDGKGIIITTIGKALDDGFKDSFIRVMNVKSGKVFMARVKGLNEVIVRF